ncbi:MAG: hypothetical protein A3K19_11480 [Lentisphaerae bacterium RIFOXYB12_FULL_65_16]|nr:MAG: hypothetical protein A3K18_09690 [Lentisphaerae bacterium RIFOXYA12_64_32]OGV90199.1 MAG: hypothetical protein A3K19_11480 [Lentisphaerae bacterium RIFOXYB12_FULL_65_16]
MANPREAPVQEIVRVSLPVPAGQVKTELPTSVTSAGARVPAQADVITRHPDGSVRRMMLSVPVRLDAKASLDFTCEPATGAVPEPALAQVEGTTATLRTDAFDLQLRDDGLQITAKGGTPLGSLRPFGPQLAGGQAATLNAIANGPLFAWLRWRQDGSDYSREVDIQADKLGRLTLTHRILRHLKENGSTPDFGFELSAPGAVPVRLPAQPVRFLALPIAEPFGKHPDLVAALKLADGTPVAMTNPLALRQHRGSLAASRTDAATILRFSRIEPVAKETDDLLLQEGMWRTLELILHPGSPEELAAAVDAPLMVRPDWRLFDAVYRTGPPLEVKSPVLKALVEKYIAALQGLSMSGDDWGSLGGLERYNHCAYIWEDVFRTSDPRLRRVALDYSENYHNFSVNWALNPEVYGGGRYPPNAKTQPWSGSFRTRQNDAVTFCTKGYHSFWLAYEETGDPRFRYAAEQQAKWSSTHVHATVNYMRCIGQVTDFVKLYEYTGDKFYLDNAVRLWTEFQACQDPDLLFNEMGVPSTGNDLYVPDDSFGYKNPYVKSYIVQYATHALPDLLAHTPNDQRLRDTIIACNDWMAKVQTAGGGWSYPGPTTAGLGWNIEYCHGLMTGHGIAPKDTYLDAIQRELRAIIALFEVYDAIPSGVTPWEYLAGMTNADLGKQYRLGTDRDRNRDFTDGRLEFGCRPDSNVYLQALLRDYLKCRPEESLFTADATLDKVLQMPTATGGPQRQSGDPSLRIAVTSSVSPEGLAVTLQGSAVYKLAGKDLAYRWAFPDGSVKEGGEVSSTFPRAGTFEVKLLARDGATEYARTVTILVPVGPGDIGLARWPDGIRVQAESLSSQGGGAMQVKVRTPQEKLGSDAGSFSHWDALGAWVEWNFEVVQAGSYFMLLKYANPAASQRLVTLDGTDVGTAKLAATGGYSSPTKNDWAVELLRDDAGKPLQLQLAAGRHVLRLANTDAKGLNLDYIEFLQAAAGK